MKPEDIRASLFVSTNARTFHFCQTCKSSIEKGQSYYKLPYPICSNCLEELLSHQRMMAYWEETNWFLSSKGRQQFFKELYDLRSVREREFERKRLQELENYPDARFHKARERAKQLAAFWNCPHYVVKTSEPDSIIPCSPAEANRLQNDQGATVLWIEYPPKKKRKVIT